MTLAAVDPKLTWYVARSAGLVAWLLCAASIGWGLFLSGKLVRRRGLPAWLLDLHTYLGTLSIVFTAIHVGGLVLDQYVHFGWRDVLVPMASAWKPGAVAWGIVAMYLLVAIQLTSWFRKRLPKRVWLAVHRTSFGLFAAGTVHGIQAGSDWTVRVVQIVTAAVTLALAALLAARVRKRRAPARVRTVPARPA